jgi:tetrahydromethanopterin S-methyltransferase subunit C
VNSDKSMRRAIAASCLPAGPLVNSRYYQIGTRDGYPAIGTVSLGFGLLATITVR